MTKLSDPIEKLAGLLKESQVKPLLVPSRLAPSPIYDLEYRSSVIAMIFQKFAKPFDDGEERRMLASKLKLLQFVTVRPWLLPAIEEWSSASAQGSLELTYSVRIRRGFLSDTAHEDVIDYLSACGILLRHGDHLVSGHRAEELEKIVAVAVEHSLFGDELRMVSDLAKVRLTTSMLEGW
jgi:hypothetical protein